MLIERVLRLRIFSVGWFRIIRRGIARISRRLRFKSVTENIRPNTFLSDAHPQQVVKDTQVKIVIIEEILRDARHDRTQGEGDGEQQNAGQRRLLLIFHPAKKFFEAAFILREKKMDDEEHPGKSQRTDNNDIERNGESAHLSASSCLAPRSVVLTAWLVSAPSGLGHFISGRPGPPAVAGCRSRPVRPSCRPSA